MRVHTLNPLADAVHWRRPDFGPAVGDVLKAIADEGHHFTLVSQLLHDGRLVTREDLGSHLANAQLARNCSRGTLVVTGQHDGLDAEFVEASHGCGS